MTNLPKHLEPIVEKIFNHYDVSETWISRNSLRDSLFNVVEALYAHLLSASGEFDERAADAELLRVLEEMAPKDKTQELTKADFRKICLSMARWQFEQDRATIAAMRAEVERWQTILKKSGECGHGQLQFENETLRAELAALRAEAKKDYDGMRSFQAKFIKSDHENIELRAKLADMKAMAYITKLLPNDEEITYEKYALEVRAELAQAQNVLDKTIEGAFRLKEKYFAENEKLRSELDKLRSEKFDGKYHDTLRADYDKVCAELSEVKELNKENAAAANERGMSINILKRERDELIEELKFYADPENYGCDDKSRTTMHKTFDIVLFDFDRNLKPKADYAGRRARAALAKIGEK